MAVVSLQPKGARTLCKRSRVQCSAQTSRRYRRDAGISEQISRADCTIPPNHAHDYWIAILLAACGHIQAMPETLIKYRRHERQQIGAGPAALSIAQQTATAIKTGRKEYLSEIAGLQQVSERLKLRSSEFGCRDSAVEAIAEKVAHRSARAMLPPLRLLRIPTVLREVANRRYWHYSEGWKSIGKDILLQRVDRASQE